MKAIAGRKYRHYKNKKQYQVLCIGTDSEQKEEVVVYQALYDDEEYGRNAIWVRPKRMFEEKVEHEGVFVDRFQKVD